MEPSSTSAYTDGTNKGYDFAEHIKPGTYFTTVYDVYYKSRQGQIFVWKDNRWEEDHDYDTPYGDVCGEYQDSVSLLTSSLDTKQQMPTCAHPEELASQTGESEDNMTAETWWGLVDGNWDDLFVLLERFVPQLDRYGTQKLKATRDPGLAKLFHDAWWKAPDQEWIRALPGWFVLCDLCTDSHALVKRD
jgi:hypothetical protein